MWKCTTVTVLILIFIFIFLHINRKEFSDKITKSSRIETKNKIKQHVPKFMLDLYHQNVNGTEFRGPDVVRSVIPTTGSSSDGVGKQKHFLIFDIPMAKKDEEFFNAELRILTFVHNGQEDNKILKISILSTNNTLLYIDKIPINPKNNSWISINLTNPVQKLLLRDPSSHLKVLICLNSQYQHLKLTLMPSVLTNFEHNYPVLLLSYNLKKLRAKRSIIDEDYEEENNYIWNRKVEMQRGTRAKNGCRKKSLYIDFAEIQYDTWIVQPSGYEAFQCLGKCYYPVAEHLSPTKHAIVQALLHSVSPLKASRSCCVPTNLDPISVLYVDSRGVLTYRYAYKDMVVSTCGCR